VKLQRAHLMAKLGAESAAELGRLAERLRLLAP
jgi:FixJ family two-component response regulator